MQFSALEAYQQAIRIGTDRKYPNREDSRFQSGLLLPRITPGFKIEAGESVFTIGSCFARNVEEALSEAGVIVPTLTFSTPEGEVLGRPNRVLNQYNPGTMFQAVRDLYRYDHEKAGIVEAKGGQVDLLLSTGHAPVSAERVQERRGEVSNLYANGLRDSSVVLITLGLVETWFDVETGLYLNDAPPLPVVKASPGRYEFRRLGVQESADLVCRMIESIGDKRILVTVSPVPLQVTFTGVDPIEANSYSKSVLRVCAEEARLTFSNVDYFPSYEIVTSAGLAAMGLDNVHVRDGFVRRVVHYMVQHYVSSSTAAIEARSMPAAHP